ncbi:MAG: replication initiator protein [Microviridae sp.]|nr:MAG: replication initiator protein [Microviridae sp.]
MKRLLKAASKHFGWRQRFFLVGEYGDRTWRPHYHAAFFNFPCCRRGGTARTLSGRFVWQDCCEVCRLVGDTWQQGDVGIGAMGPERARYLGGYVQKKLTKKGDPRLDGRFPEFSRQSRGGSVKGAVGIGGPVVSELASTFNKYCDASSIDVAGYLTGAGGRRRPLGRYLKNKFREAVGTTEEVKQDASRQAWVEQMLPLQEASKADVEAPSLRAQIIKNSLAVDARLKFQEDLYRQKRKGRDL